MSHILVTEDDRQVTEYRFMEARQQASGRPEHAPIKIRPAPTRQLLPMQKNPVKPDAITYQQSPP